MWRLSVYEFLKHFQVIKQKKENITLSFFTDEGEERWGDLLRDNVVSQ